MPTVPHLLAFAVSHWADDPWSRGSWSLIGRDGTPADRTGLGAPIGTRLRIAGEATHATRAGMTHGAYEQGIAAAAWAADLGHARVDVVGAGMAGLAAARELTARGVTVRVWEARDRIGGRTAGADVGGFRFDLGANWLQQYDENALARLAEELGLTTIATDFADPLVLGPPAPPVTDPDGLDRELRARLAAAPAGAGVAEVLDAWLRDPTPWAAETIHRFADAEIMMDSGVPLAWLSARHGFEPGVGEGDRWIVGSYRLLVDHLAEGIDVRLRHPVRRIRVDDDGVALVASQEGGDTPREHGENSDTPREHGENSDTPGEHGENSDTPGEITARADAVIVTAPVAVLAAGAIEFEPPLPTTHRAALARLGMGRVEKVVLRFDRRFWPARDSGYYRIHGPEHGCVSEWLDATPADGTPTLAGLFAGPWLDALWAGPDAEVADRATAVFTNALDRYETD